MITRTHALLLAAMCMASPALADDWAVKMFGTTNHDFGAVARGSKTEFQFVLTNIYEEDVHVAAVRSSCGCTSTRVTQETLKTYEKGAIVASLDTREHLGQKSATLTVVFDKPFYAEVQLQVAGYIRSDVVFNPGQVDFGQVKPREAVEKRIAVEYAGRDDWQVTEVKAVHDYLQAEVAETSREGGHVGYELVVKLKENAPEGYLNELVYLVTNDRRNARVPVEVVARVAGDLTVSPASLSLGVVRPGQKVTKRLVVRGSAPFKITAVNCDDQAFEFAPSDAAKTVHLVPVTFTASGATGKFNRRIEIETDLLEGLKAECLAHVQVSEAPPQTEAGAGTAPNNETASAR